MGAAVIHVPADYTAATYRSLARSGLACPRFATHYQRAGIYLLLHGTPARAAACAHACDDDDACELLLALPRDPIDDAADRMNACIGWDRPDPRSGVLAYDHRVERPGLEIEPRRGRARRRRIDRPLPLCTTPEHPWITMLRAYHRPASEQRAADLRAAWSMAKRVARLVLRTRARVRDRQPWIDPTAADDLARHRVALARALARVAALRGCDGRST